MIRKVVNKCDLRNFSSIKEDLSYWLSKTPEERSRSSRSFAEAVSWKYRETSKICSSY